MALITLLTDFGTADGYVGEMKGVMYAMHPQAQLVDIAHDVAPQDVDGARLAIARYWRRFPLGTVHLVVVDPGVGGSRRPIALRAGGHLFEEFWPDIRHRLHLGGSTRYRVS